MKASIRFLAAGLAGLALGLAGAASADAPAAQPAKKPAVKNDCFLSNQWQGWRAPDEKTIYLRVNVKDIYRVDLSAGSSLLMWPDVHLVNVMHGSSYVCSPLDLQLSVVESGGGARSFVIAKSITKLTPEQIAAIPKKFLP